MRGCSWRWLVWQEGEEGAMLAPQHTRCVGHTRHTRYVSHTRHTLIHPLTHALVHFPVIKKKCATLRSQNPANKKERKKEEHSHGVQWCIHGPSPLLSAGCLGSDNFFERQTDPSPVMTGLVHTRFVTRRSTRFEHPRAHSQGVLAPSLKGMTF